MQRWIRLLIEGNWLRGSNRQRLAGVAEALVAASFLLGGFVFLSISITLAIIHAQNGNVSIIDLHFILRVIIATFLILIGLGWIIRLLWHVGVSAERREAISAQADELEILRELRHRREDLQRYRVIDWFRNPAEPCRFGSCLCPETCGAWSRQPC